MQCPHCRIAIHPEPFDIMIGEDSDGGWLLRRVHCPACKRWILHLVNGHPKYTPTRQFAGVLSDHDKILVRPKSHARAVCPPDVPEDVRKDYEESCRVLSDSPKASAALSRRCLQHILRTVGGMKPADLAAEIQQVLDSGKLPTQLADSVDAIRNIGNFAAHPVKSQHTGEIVEVEPGEADWNLDVLEGLFDFYYVQPAVLKRKRAALDKKLSEAGKPPMK